MRLLLANLLFCVANLYCRAAIISLYTAKDCEMPVDTTKQSEFWNNFDFSKVSVDCYEELRAGFGSRADKVAIGRNFFLKLSPKLPLKTRQHHIDTSVGNYDFPSKIMPEGEDCDVLDFSKASEYFIKFLSANAKCLAKLEKDSAASLAKNPQILKYLKLHKVNPKQLYHFIPLLLQENNGFLGIQENCDLDDEEESWCLALLKEIDETKVSKSFSDALNSLTGDISGLKFEGKHCSEAEMFGASSSFDQSLCGHISRRCYHHVTKNFSAKNFAEITEKCIDKLYLRFYTIQLALDTRCVSSLAKLVVDDTKPYDLSRACGDIISTLYRSFSSTMPPTVALSLTKNKDFKFIRSFNEFSPETIKLFHPFMTLEQVQNTEQSLLQMSDPDKSASVFLNNEVRDAFKKKAHNTEPLTEAAGGGNPEDGGGSQHHNDDSNKDPDSDKDKSPDSDKGPDSNKGPFPHPSHLVLPKVDENDAANAAGNKNNSPTKKDDPKDGGKADHLTFSFMFSVALLASIL